MKILSFIPFKLYGLMVFALVVLSFSMANTSSLAANQELLNVSYDPTRELYEEYNAWFKTRWKEKTGNEINIKQSHGGSGKQARSVIDGLKADVVTLALAADIDAIAEKGKSLPENWQGKLPHNSAPYTSTIVFLVRKGNPKNIHDWDDLIKEGVQVITPNPKTSGGARWNYLAAYGYGLKKFDQDDTKARIFLKQIFNNVPVLDTGARGSTTTFAERGIGDVLLAWENEAFLAVEKGGANAFEIIVPSLSIVAEPPVAVVEKNAARKNNTEVATAYLTMLYEPEAQEIIAKHYYRPADETVAARYADQFPQIEMLKISDFGGWKKVQADHFDDGGVFDQIYKP